MLTAKERTNLQALLSHAVRPEEALNIHQLEGYLFGIVLTPDVTQPSEWFEDIFGEALASFDDAEEANSRFADLTNAYNRLNRLRLEGGLRFPFDLARTDEAMLERLRLWADGLDRALALRSWVWMPEEVLEKPEMSAEEEEIMTALMVVLGVAHPEKIPEIFEGIEDTEEGQREVWSMLVGELPAAVERLQDHAVELESERLAGMQECAGEPAPWVRKPGRNEPCPCGSGKKYKKCCGLN